MLLLRCLHFFGQEPYYYGETQLGLDGPVIDPNVEQGGFQSPRTGGGGGLASKTALEELEAQECCYNDISAALLI